MQQEFQVINNRSEGSQIHSPSVAERPGVNFADEDEESRSRENADRNSVRRLRQSVCFLPSEAGSNTSHKQNVKNIFQTKGVLNRKRDSMPKVPRKAVQKANNLLHKFRVSYLVREFARVMVQTLLQRNFARLNGNHLSFLDDQAYFRERRELGSGARLFDLYFVARLCAALQRSFVIVPEGSRFNAWVLVVVVVNFVQLYTLSLDLAFGQDRFFGLGDWYGVLQGVSYVVFLADVARKFFTTYDEQETRVVDLRRIARNYLRGEFRLEFALLVLFLLDAVSPNFACKVLNLLRVRFIVDNWQIFRDNRHLFEKYNVRTTLFQLGFVIIMCAHLWSCGFILVGQHSDPELNWLEQQHRLMGHPLSVPQTYVSALYYSVITMITIGYGDITPVNVYEKLYVIVMTFCSCATFAYAVNVVGSIFSERAQQQAKFKQNKFVMLKYMRERGIRQPTQQAIFRQLVYLQNKHENEVQHAQEIMSDFRQELKDNLLAEFFGGILARTQFISANLSPDILRQLALKMQETVFGPEEYIVRQGTYNRKLLIIRTGQATELVERLHVQKTVHSKSVNMNYPGAPLILNGVSECQGFSIEESANTGLGGRLTLRR